MNWKLLVLLLVLFSASAFRPETKAYKSMHNYSMFLFHGNNAGNIRDHFSKEARLIKKGEFRYVVKDQSIAGIAGKVKITITSGLCSTEQCMRMGEQSVFYGFNDEAGKQSLLSENKKGYAEGVLISVLKNDHYKLSTEEYQLVQEYFAAL